MIPPKPYFGHQHVKFDILTHWDEMWYGRLELLFECTCRPLGYKKPDKDLCLQLALISTFEPINLVPDSILTKQGCSMLYEPKSPILYCVQVRDILGRVPLMPCFLRGNETPTIPASFSIDKVPRTLANRKKGLVPDSEIGGGNGSKLFRINLWLWNFATGMPRSKSVAQTSEERQKKEADRRAKIVISKQMGTGNPLKRKHSLGP